VRLNERQIEIGRMIQRRKRLDVNDLVERFGTSAVTIRKDLDSLQARGILQRTHGGAVLAEDVEKTITVDTKLGHMLPAKQAIARAAEELVLGCEAVALDAGSSTLAVARQMKSHDVRVVTNSLLIAEELADSESGRMILVGGSWRRESSCFIGPAALDALDKLNVDVAFVGTSGFSVETGFACQNSMEAQVKTRMLERAERTFIVADSSKYKVRAFTTFARLDDVTGLIVDDGLPAADRDDLAAAGLHLIVARDTQ
jgi:DeoR/GlpR family transcriptional regulator of sugar metabolism